MDEFEDNHLQDPASVAKANVRSAIYAFQKVSGLFPTGLPMSMIKAWSSSRQNETVGTNFTTSDLALPWDANCLVDLWDCIRDALGSAFNDPVSVIRCKAQECTELLSINELLPQQLGQAKPGT